MRERLFVGVLLVLTALFCWALGWIAWGFARAGTALGWGFALAICALLVLAVWVTWREVLFGLAAARLGRAYRTDTAPVEPSADASADPRAEFEAARAEAEGTGEGDWRAWYRLGLAYDALRDRRHARESVRRAIELERAGR
ncbi:tetratricopeptide repeat protein [Brachybacterium nesterenkovii]|uniref:tetratricopeptide repeat protein n=1 Tax=Brachybacterium nesterenkovii TaxID=47847 RepID=UPI0032194019